MSFPCARSHAPSVDGQVRPCKRELLPANSLAHGGGKAPVRSSTVCRENMKLDRSAVTAPRTRSGSCPRKPDASEKAVHRASRPAPRRFQKSSSVPREGRSPRRPEICPRWRTAASAAPSPALRAAQPAPAAGAETRRPDGTKAGTAKMRPRRTLRKAPARTRTSKARAEARFCFCKTPTGFFASSATASPMKSGSSSGSRTAANSHSPSAAPTAISTMVPSFLARNTQHPLCTFFPKFLLLFCEV